jgi:hypothetical protein
MAAARQSQPDQSVTKDMPEIKGLAGRTRPSRPTESIELFSPASNGRTNVWRSGRWSHSDLATGGAPSDPRREASHVEKKPAREFELRPKQPVKRVQREKLDSERFC